LDLVGEAATGNGEGRGIFDLRFEGGEAEVFNRSQLRERRRENTERSDGVMECWSDGQTTEFSERKSAKETKQTKNGGDFDYGVEKNIGAKWCKLLRNGARRLQWLTVEEKMLV
jgi:hypothetical protein